MNVRVDVLYWINGYLLNKRPTMMCLAKKKMVFFGYIIPWVFFDRIPCVFF